jgi:hypothetical protein
MTRKATRTSPHIENAESERHQAPVSLYLAGTVVVMNVCVTVLSLMS